MGGLLSLSQPDPTIDKVFSSYVINKEVTMSQGLTTMRFLVSSLLKLCIPLAWYLFSGKTRGKFHNLAFFSGHTRSGLSIGSPEQQIRTTVHRRETADHSARTDSSIESRPSLPCLKALSRTCAESGARPSETAGLHGS